jgi:hypothetical protein
MVNTFFLLRIRSSVKSELNLIDPTSKAKERHVGSLYHTHKFLTSAQGAARLVSRNRHEWFQSFYLVKPLKAQSHIQVVVERDEVEGPLKFQGWDLIVDESLFWKQVKVLL